MMKLPLAALAAALLVAPAAAQNLAPAGSSQIVEFADLDLTSDSGRTALDRRIRAAVQSVCGTESSADPRGRHNVRDCRAETLSLANAARDQAIAAAQRGGSTLLASQR